MRSVKKGGGGGGVRIYSVCSNRNLKMWARFSVYIFNLLRTVI